MASLNGQGLASSYYSDKVVPPKIRHSREIKSGALKMQCVVFLSMPAEYLLKFDFLIFRDSVATRIR